MSTQSLKRAPYAIFIFCISIFILSCWPLIAHAERLPALIKMVQPAEIFPNADRFGSPEGKPMFARVYQGDKELGVVYITSDVVNTRGYSSKPIDTIVGLATDGTVVGAKLLAHNEPIVLIGIPRSKVDTFIDGYIGMNPTTNPPKAGQTPSEIVSGATVTVVVIGDSIIRSARMMTAALAKQNPNAVAHTTKPVKTRPHRLPDMTKEDIQSWQQMLDSGAITNLHLTVGEVNKLLTDLNPAVANNPEKGAPEETFINMYTALVSQPSVGKSLLGEKGYEELKRSLKPNQSAIIIAGEGRYSWKGSGYVRGGIFDRVEVIQNDNGFRFTDLLHTRLINLHAEGAPHFKEVSLFVTPDDFPFDPAEAWRLQLIIQHEIGVQNKVFLTTDLDYLLPKELSVDDPNGEPVPTGEPLEEVVVADNAAQVEEEVFVDDNPQKALWKQIWVSKIYHVIVLVIALLLLGIVFFFQNYFVRFEKGYRRFRLIYLTFTLFYVGWYLQAQLSVVNVLTISSSVISGSFSWDYFLMDPFVFTLWSAVAIAMLFWGRGAFCGWLCPFGALQELTNAIAKKLGVKQLTIPFGVHTRLTAIKYVIFMVLFGVSLYELGLAEKLAEVEPFKTAIILKFMREWWFVLFAVALLVAGLFIERFFCRYLCPLGAAMAIPAKLQIFNWLRRYHMCGNPCQICNHECPVQAIEPEGNINPNECVQCLHCQVMYHHETKCPQLVAKNKRRAKRTASQADNTAAPTEAKVNEQVVHFVKPTKELAAEK